MVSPCWVHCLHPGLDQALSLEICFSTTRFHIWVTESQLLGSKLSCRTTGTSAEQISPAAAGVPQSPLLRSGPRPAAHFSLLVPKHTSPCPCGASFLSGARVQKSPVSCHWRLSSLKIPALTRQKTDIRKSSVTSYTGP